MLLKRLGQQDGGQRLKYGAQAAQTGLSHHITGVALLHDACKAEEEAGHQSAQHKRAPGIDAHHLSYIRIAAHRPGIETDGGLVIGHVSDDNLTQFMVTAENAEDFYEFLSDENLATHTISDEEYQNLLVRNNPDVDYDYFYDFLTNYEENVYAKVEANAAQ